MKLSISNIGWKAEDDESVYEIMKKNGYEGLEIAPTRIFPEKPYEDLKTAKEWSNDLRNKYGFAVSSMQSIWFGRKESIFGTIEERKILVDYTKRAIDFAETIKCKNLVFGCPRNRNLPEGADSSEAILFFKEISEYALTHGTVIGMEANPTIYNTNYINDTLSALQLIEEVGSDGFKLNLDFGTMIQNEETLEELTGNVNLINHVHISEPGLKLIEKRDSHYKLADILQRENYKGFVSVEMGKRESIEEVEGILMYVKEIFG